MYMRTAKGLKHDKNKPGMHLLDRTALEQIARVLDFGAEKYSAHNWREGIHYSRLIAASMRHLTAINDGEDVDPESKLPHAAHLGCCVMFLLWMMENRKDLDDRWKPTRKPANDYLRSDADDAAVRDLAARLRPANTSRSPEETRTHNVGESK